MHDSRDLCLQLSQRILRWGGGGGVGGAKSTLWPFCAVRVGDNEREGPKPVVSGP